MEEFGIEPEMLSREESATFEPSLVAAVVEPERPTLDITDEELDMFT